MFGTQQTNAGNIQTQDATNIKTLVEGKRAGQATNSNKECYFKNERLAQLNKKHARCDLH